MSTPRVEPLRSRDVARNLRREAAASSRAVVRCFWGGMVVMCLPNLKTDLDPVSCRRWIHFPEAERRPGGVDVLGPRRGLPGGNDHMLACGARPEAGGHVYGGAVCPRR